MATFLLSSEHRSVLDCVEKFHPASIAELSQRTNLSHEAVTVALAQLSHLQLIRLADPSTPGAVFVQPNGRNTLKGVELEILDFIHSRRKATHVSEIPTNLPHIDLAQATHTILDLLSRQFISLKPHSKSTDLEVMSSPHPALARDHGSAKQSN